MGYPNISLIGQESLLMHASGRPGKLEIMATKPLTTQRDLTLAYSPWGCGAVPQDRRE